MRWSSKLKYWVGYKNKMSELTGSNMKKLSTEKCYNLRQLCTGWNVMRLKCYNWDTHFHQRIPPQLCTFCISLYSIWFILKIIMILFSTFFFKELNIVFQKDTQILIFCLFHANQNLSRKPCICHYWVPTPLTAVKNRQYFFTSKCTALMTE